MSQLRKVVLAAVAFLAAGFGSVAMAGCGGNVGGSSCGGRSGLLSKLHARKDACSGTSAKSCGGGLLRKLNAKRGAKCSGAASCSAPAPAPACAPAPVASDCGTCSSSVASEGVVDESGAV